MKICSQSSSTYYSAHKSSNHSTIMIDNWGLGYGPNENCSLIPDCADHHNDYDCGGDDHCGDSLWSQSWTLFMFTKMMPSMVISHQLLNKVNNNNDKTWPLFWLLMMSTMMITNQLLNKVRRPGELHRSQLRALSRAVHRPAPFLSSWSRWCWW